MKQREMLFRVFNVLTQEYDRNLIPSADITAEGYFRFIFAPDQMLVEQYTGYKDNEGVRIFEGNLLRLPDENNLYKVVMKNGIWEMYSRDGSIVPLMSLEKYGGIIVGSALTNKKWE